MDAVTDKNWEEVFLQKKAAFDVAKKEYDDMLVDFQKSLELHGETSLGGKNVSLSLVPRGAKYAMTENVAEEFLVTKKTLNTDKVETYYGLTGELPIGVTELPRNKTITPYIRKDADDQE